MTFLGLPLIGWIILGVGFVLIMWHEKRKRARSPVPFVVVQAPGSHIFRNLVVLGVVVGLGWFFWYVMGTRCHGQC